MTETVVDGLYQRNKTLVEFLERSGEVSLLTDAEDSFRRILVLSVSSYFEHRIRETVLEFVVERTNSDDSILSLVKTKAIERQYHTFFQWDGKNANSFFSMFGEHFSTRMKELVS